MSLSLAVMIWFMSFAFREGWEEVPSLVILCGYAAPKLFLLGLLFAGVLRFIRGEGATQRANQIAQVSGEILIAHLIDVSDTTQSGKPACR
jgi:hypothetical protein